jgi:uncharacterized repeat protein (TIGR04052 family)
MTSSNLDQHTRLFSRRGAALALFVTSLGGLWAVGCSNDDTAETPAAVGPSGPSPVVLRFGATVGGTPFACGQTFAGVGTSGKTVKPVDFRFYVHDIRLVNAADEETPVALDDDGKWQDGTVGLLDFEDNSGACENGNSDLNKQLTGTVPAGTFDRVRFRLGVPFAKNHADVASAPSPLNVTSLFWNWNGGYKFARLDGVVDGATAPDGGPLSFVFHLGSTECDGDAATGGVKSCAKPNVPEIELRLADVGQTVGTDLGGKTMVLDWAALLAGVDLANDQGGMPGCMSGAADPECATLFETLGLSIATGLPDAATGGAQSAFHVE